MCVHVLLSVAARWFKIHDFIFLIGETVCKLLDLLTIWSFLQVEN